MTVEDLEKKLKVRIAEIDGLYDSLFRPILPSEQEQVVDSLKAIGDISSLCHAHTTKIGIAFRPPVSAEAAEKTLDEWMKLPVVFIAAYASFLMAKNGDKSDIFVTQIRSRIRDLFDCYKALLAEMVVALNADADVKQTSNAGLQAIGQIWAKCDELKKISAGDITDMAADVLETYIAFAQDALEELKGEAEEGEEEGEADDKDKNKKEQSSAPISCVTLLIILWKAIVKRRCKDQAMKGDEAMLKETLAISNDISSMVDDLACEISDDAESEEVSNLTNELADRIMDLADAVQGEELDDQFTKWIKLYKENYKKKIQI